MHLKHTIPSFIAGPNYVYCTWVWIVFLQSILLLHDPFFFYFQALNKKEHKGCDSPDPECDPYSMSSMNFEEKYNRMNEDYQRVLQQNQLRVSRIETSMGGSTFIIDFDIICP